MRSDRLSLAEFCKIEAIRPFAYIWNRYGLNDCLVAIGGKIHI